MSNFNRSLSTLLADSPLLHDFVAKLQQLYQINQAIMPKLPPELQPHCRVANLRDSTLILATTSPTWNHKLRFYRFELLSSLRAEPAFAGLKAIEVRVEYLPTHENNNSQPTKPLKTMSQTAAKAISMAAATISNRRLAESLQKLSKVLKP